MREKSRVVSVRIDARDFENIERLCDLWGQGTSGVIKRALERSVCQMEEREGDLAENLESKLELVAGKYTGGVS